MVADIQNAYCFNQGRIHPPKLNNRQLPVLLYVDDIANFQFGLASEEIYQLLWIILEKRGLQIMLFPKALRYHKYQWR